MKMSVYQQRLYQQFAVSACQLPVNAVLRVLLTHYKRAPDSDCYETLLTARK